MRYKYLLIGTIAIFLIWGPAIWLTVDVNNWTERYRTKSYVQARLSDSVLYIEARVVPINNPNEERTIWTSVNMPTPINVLRPYGQIHWGEIPASIISEGLAVDILSAKDEHPRWNHETTSAQMVVIPSYDPTYYLRVYNHPTLGSTFERYIYPPEPRLIRHEQIVSDISLAPAKLAVLIACGSGILDCRIKF